MTDAVNAFFKRVSLIAQVNYAKKRLAMRSTGVFLLIFSVLFGCLIDPIPVYAASSKDIRVGLTDLYGKKARITIYNDSVVIGYCKNNSFIPTCMLNSPGGFTFEPDDRHYLAGNTTYDSIDKAMAAGEPMGNLGCEVYYVLTGSRSWKIYLLPFNNDRSIELQTAYQKEYSDILFRNVSSTIIRVTSSNSVFLIDAYPNLAYPQFKAVSGGKQVPVSLGTRKYRGRIEIIREKGKLTAINNVGIEAYLLGVVTCEMGAGKPAEALKAQAVAARSFAIAKAGFLSDSDPKNYFTLNDTTDSQVYKGVLYETEAGYNAVKSTAGEVIIDSDGNIVQAFYFSTDGGSTDSGTDMWNVSSNIFEPVFDIYEKNPEVEPWLEDISLKEIASVLKSKGYDTGEISDISVSLRSEGGRAMQVKIRCTGGKVTISGNEFRNLFDLPSAKFRIITPDEEQNKVSIINSEKQVNNKKLSETYAISEKGIISSLDNSEEQYILVNDGDFFTIPVFIIGLGSGHGVGMSQSGAAGMASLGYGYREILDFYYHNIHLGTY